MTGNKPIDTIPWLMASSLSQAEEEEAAGCKREAKDTMGSCVCLVCVTITKHPLKNTRT